MQIFYYLIPTFWNAITIAASVPVYDHPVRICHQIWTSKTSLRICKGVGKKGFCYVNLLQKKKEKWWINTNSIPFNFFSRLHFWNARALGNPTMLSSLWDWESHQMEAYIVLESLQFFFFTQLYEFLQIDKQIKLLFVAWPFHICQHFHDGKIFFGNKVNRQIFQVIRTGGTSKSGILPKLCHMSCFWELVRCEKYFGSQPAHRGVGPHPKFQPTE